MGQRLLRYYIFFLAAFFTGCIEEFVPESITFENILVVEATLTDEMVRQKILISRTTPLESTAINPETGAEVTVIDGSQNEILFEEVTPGEYLSVQPFMALENEVYQLQIQTSEGVQYQSGEARMPGTGSIDEIKASRKINENGTDGVEITVDGSLTSDGIGYLRYEYEETYQIISLFNPSTDLFIVSENPPLAELRQREKQDRVCYATNVSNQSVLAKTQGLIGNKIENVAVRFLANDDFILRSRYSINVRQFTQTREAHSFYENLQEFSNVESLFAQTQTGFIQGNIRAVQNSSEVKVLGYFEISSVSSKRIFFNFRDIFPDENFPTFIANCAPSTFLGGFSGTEPELIDLLKSGAYRFVTIEFGAFYLAPAKCVDCTLLGTNIEPDFWEE